MNRIVTFSLAASTMGALVVAAAPSPMLGEVPVLLQNSTPGVAQNGSMNISSVAMAGQFRGGGVGLTGLNATNLGAGIVPDARLAANVARTNANNVFSGVNRFGANLLMTNDSASLMFPVAEGTTNPMMYLFSGPSTASRMVFAVDPSQKMNGLEYRQADQKFIFRDGTASTLLVDVVNQRVGIRSGGEWALAVSANASDGGVAISSAVQALRATASGTNDAVRIERLGSGHGLGISMHGPQSEAGVFISAQRSQAIYAFGTLDSPVDYLVRFSASSPSSGGLTSQSVGRAAVRGLNQGTGGTTYGGFFSTSNPTGYAVQGEGTSGRGVFGWATSTTAGTTPYGVRGTCSTLTDGYAVYSAGDTGASGTKSFRIDHPHDPENKFLLHYSSESPFPQNFYNGNVTTDDEGFAWVVLPEYFEDINTNLKYVLTVVDESESEGFVQVKVSKKVVGNRFQVRTSEPRVEVSWMVMADRNDLRVRFNRPTDVRDKGVERGKYDHPEYYGKTATFSIDQPTADTTSAKVLKN